MAVRSFTQIVEDAERRAKLPVPSHNAERILSYREAIAKLQRLPYTSSASRAAAERMVRQYEDRIRMLDTPAMVAA